MNRTRITPAVGAVALVLLAGTLAAACDNSAPSSSRGHATTVKTTTHKTSTGHSHGKARTTSHQKVTLSGVHRSVKPSAKPQPKPTPLPVKPATLSGDIVSTDGIGPIEFGMTVSQAETASGITFAQHYWSGPECQLATSTLLPGVTFNVDHQNDTVMAVDIESPATQIKTLSGIGVGATASELKSTYGSELRIISYFYNGEVKTHNVAEYSVEAGGGRSVAFSMDYKTETVHDIVAGQWADGLSFC